jgi:hypothetical protein
MKRREFVSLLTGAVIGWTFPAKAQRAGKIAHIGYLSVAAGRNPLDETFEHALQQLGWMINRNITIEYRYVGGRQDRVAPITEEVIRSHLGEPELGALLICETDFDIAATGSGEVTLTRDQTIMQGAPSCTFRYKFAPR